jgi:Rrf2 family protein
MKLSRTVWYAVQATLQLAQLEGQAPVPCSRLAAEGKMPERFLLQILRNLVTHGILRSTRGVDGGYALVRPADQISLLEVIEAIEGPYDASLTVSEGLTEDSQEKLREALSQVTAATRHQLEAIKLSQLLKPPATSKSGEQART